jgi:hypothetical protein
MLVAGITVLTWMMVDKLDSRGNVILQILGGKMLDKAVRMHRFKPAYLKG